MTLQPGQVPVVRFEGVSSGTEIWGMTQANFLVSIPKRHAKEAAVQLTDAAVRRLSQELAEEDSPEFRARLATAAGFAFLQPLADARAEVPSVTVISEAFLDEHPMVRAALKPAAAVG